MIMMLPSGRQWPFALKSLHIYSQCCSCSSNPSLWLSVDNISDEPSSSPTVEEPKVPDSSSLPENGKPQKSLSSECLSQSDRKNMPYIHLPLFPQTAEKPRRPATIPLQTRIANCVRLTGWVRQPIQRGFFPNGKEWAGTVLIHGKGAGSSRLCIPITFEGDWAKTISCNVKVNDFIYVMGELSGDEPPVILDGDEASIQVIVNNFSFVHPQHTDRNPVRTRDATFWKDFIENFPHWRDMRIDKLQKLVHEKFPDFHNALTGEGIWLSTTPQWVLAEIGKRWISASERSTESPREGDQSEEGLCKAATLAMGVKNKDEAFWRNFLANITCWRDWREDKLNGLVHPNHPDFKNEETGVGLWLDSAPHWVLEEMENPKHSENQ